MNSWILALVALITALASIGVAIINSQNSKTATKITVDAAAIARAESIWRGMIDDLVAQNKDFKIENSDLRMEVRKLSERVADLEKNMGELGIAIPPHR